MESKQSLTLKAALAEFKQFIDQFKLPKKLDAPLFAGKNTGYVLTPAIAMPAKKSTLHEKKSKIDKDEDEDEFEEVADNEKIEPTPLADDDTTITKAFYNLWADLDCVFNSWSGLPSLIARDTNRTQIKNDIAAVFKIFSNPANVENSTFLELIIKFQPILATFIETKNSYLASFPKSMRDNVGGKGDALLLALQITLEAAIKQHQIKQAHQRFNEALKSTSPDKNQLKLITDYRNEILRQAFDSNSNTSSLNPVIILDDATALEALQTACVNEKDADQTALKERLSALANTFVKQIDNTPHVAFVQHRMGISYSEPFAAYTKTLIDILAELKEQEIALSDSSKKGETSKNTVKPTIPIPEDADEGTRLLGEAINGSFDILHAQKNLQKVIEKIENKILAAKSETTPQHSPTEGEKFAEQLLDESTRISKPTIQKEIQRELTESQKIKQIPKDKEEVIEIEIGETNEALHELTTWRKELQERNQVLQELKTSDENNSEFICKKLEITHEQLNHSLRSSSLMDKINQEIELNEEQIKNVDLVCEKENQELINLAKQIENLKESVNHYRLKAVAS